MKRFLLIILSLIFISVSEVSAQGKIEFDSESHDFGNVPEGTLAEHEFVFTNKGTTPVIISDVQASCGCTTPFWTKDPVMPEGKGTIKASYNSQGRPGAFHKSITVTSNATEATKVLYIKGTVTENLSSSTEQKIKLNTQFIEFGEVYKNENSIKSLSFSNISKAKVSLATVISPCNCLTLKPGKEVDPNGNGSFEIVLNSKNTGHLREIVSLMTTDGSETKFVIQADVIERPTQSIIKESSSNPF